MFGVMNDLKGQVPLALFVTKDSYENTSDALLAEELVNMVRSKLGAVACFKDALRVERLPKTRSGKILRSTLRSIANDTEFKVPATIEDPAVLQEIEAIIRQYTASLS